jgi:hypothetical protein
VNTSDRRGAKMRTPEILLSHHPIWGRSHPTLRNDDDQERNFPTRDTRMH